MSAGLDSLSSVELRNALQARFDLDLPVTVMFDHPTVQALAGFISGQLLEKEADGQNVQVVRYNPVAALQDLVGQLQSTVAGVLGNSVPADQPLMAAGLDSLGKLMRRTTNTPLPRNPTIATCHLQVWTISLSLMQVP